jgi:hypothetical protein
MKESTNKALFFAGLFLFLQVNTSFGYVAGRAGHDETSVRKARDEEGHKLMNPEVRKDDDLKGVCVLANSACMDGESKAIKTFTNINNQPGCDEKCTETVGCNW